jgi:tetratricopeptide (TPR) repeat protein
MPSFAHGLLARIALRRKDLAQAEAEARLAMASGSDRILPRLTLAEVLHARGAYEEALALLDEAGRLHGERGAPDPDLLQGRHLIAGKVHADLGRVDEAERSFREEIRLFPEDVRAYSNLALLYALTGRTAASAGALREMTEAIPTPLAYAEAARTLRALDDERGAQTVLRYARRRFPHSPLLRDLDNRGEGG